MADSLIQALQAGLYRPTDTTAGIGAQAIAAGLPALQNPYASTGSNLAYSVGGSLLAGLLGGIGRQQAQEENAALLPLMGQIMQAPASERAALAAGNERLSPLVQALMWEDYGSAQKVKDAVNVEQALAPIKLRNLTDEKLVDAGFSQGIVPTETGMVPIDDLGLKSPQDLKLEEAQAMIPLDAEKAKAVETAKFEAEADSYGYNPKKEQELEKLRKEFSALPEVKNFSIIERTAGIVDKVLKDPNAVTDLELTRYAILAIEPGMAVREGEQAAVANSQSVPDALKGQWLKAMKGESSLSEEARAGIRNLMVRAYEGHKSQYDRTLSYFQGEAAAKGLDKNRISYIGQSSPTSEIIQPAADDQAAALAELQRRGLVP